MTSTGPTITAGITTKHGPLSIEDTLTRLAELIADRGMKVFDVIDQSAEARSVLGRDLPATNSKYESTSGWPSEYRALRLATASDSGREGWSSQDASIPA